MTVIIDNSLQTQLAKELQGLLKPKSKLLVGFSGGLDSRVLLELLSKLCTDLDFELSALHVHHGLSPNADHWAHFCTEVCDQLAVPLTIERVVVSKDSGLGIEASARLARYQALNAARATINADYIVLAHHQDDQAETLLLQLMRGAGLKGLSAMAKQDDARYLLRPLLNISRHELEVFASANKLRWIDDESNEDEHFDRNFCRHQILDVITQRFPAAKTTIARTASHMAEASQLLDELAVIDFADSFNLQDSNKACLKLETLASLSEPRAHNLLRWWLVQHKQTLPSTAKLQEIYQQLTHAKADATVKVVLDNPKGMCLRRYQGIAYIQKNAVASNISLTWQGEDNLVLPDASRLSFEYVAGQGLALERIGVSKLRITHRHGGERFKPHAARPTRTLKHLLQEANIPPWQRDCLPLIYANDVLAVVPTIGVASSMQAAEHEQGLVIKWLGRLD